MLKIQGSIFLANRNQILLGSIKSKMFYVEMCSTATEMTQREAVICNM